MPKLSMRGQIKEAAERIRFRNPDDTEIIDQYKIAYNHYRERVIEGDNQWHDLRKYYILTEAYRVIAKERSIDLPKDESL